MFEIPLLTRRLAGATRWLRREPSTAQLAIGYLVAGSGAPAAMRAAAVLVPEVGAIVTQAGCGDVDASCLGAVSAPTLLIVGGEDRQALEYTRRLRPRLCCPNELVVVANATHSFTEPGTLDRATDLALTWFSTHLAPATDGHLHM
jgi:putative phosphoribosyl transferase